MQAWVQRAIDASGKTTVLNTHLGLKQFRTALLIGMLFVITTTRATNAGTHNKCCKAWTYQHISAAQPNSDAIKSFTHSDAYHPYQ